MGRSINIVISTIVLAVNGIVLRADGFVLSEKDNSAELSNTDYSKDTMIADFNKPPTSIRHFARHGLCNSYEGKRNMYAAMKTKLCNISLSMIQSVVLDLCRRKNHMLDKWVEELFDIDGNGYISHFEKHFYH
ncbi:uncharacterized protein LOC132727543 [Ruditapes philippinarum]|uniref:uncharacterized protein LOC132727543 n=1 Tax=Ruditapes philippinarum TaxID=129788 RepID=UPI00295AB2AA|nr:uncharacterized protein LOC132727543 [Ruditapes philippinarum]